MRDIVNPGPGAGRPCPEALSSTAWTCSGMDHVMFGRRSPDISALAAYVAVALCLFAPGGAAWAGTASAWDGGRMRLATPEETAQPLRLLPVRPHGLNGARPARPIVSQTSWRKMTVSAGPNGHFYVTARVKRPPPSYSFENITFLVDTGASLVALSREDAKKLGFELKYLDFSGVSQTANGEVHFASVMLPEVRIGSLKVRKVPASIVDGKLEVSLLGNSFLGRLKSYQVSHDELVMRW